MPGRPTVRAAVGEEVDYEATSRIGERNTEGDGLVNPDNDSGAVGVLRGERPFLSAGNCPCGPALESL